jgi:hypothetical protein
LKVKSEVPGSVARNHSVGAAGNSEVVVEVDVVVVVDVSVSVIDRVEDVSGS